MLKFGQYNSNLWISLTFHLPCSTKSDVFPSP
nr:MAG TPA: hypothetical protein [Caudoviricetes sp.]